jgi:hypothetical protein
MQHYNSKKEMILPLYTYKNIDIFVLRKIEKYVEIYGNLSKYIGIH